MKVIFLSAGKGTRMLPLTKNTPKPLLEIGGGITIIEHQLNSIVECGGVEEVIFVIGYRAEQIEAKLKNYKKVPIRFLYNPFYASSNNLISMWFAISAMKEDFILINGDDIFKPKVLRKLMAHDKEDDIVMVIDRKKKYLVEDMKVITKKDMVTQVSKEIPVEIANGESIGMIRYANKGRKYIIDTLNAMVRDEQNKHIFYLSAVQRIIDEGRPVHFMECKESDWAEVDFHLDLNLVRDNMLQYRLKGN